MRVAIYPRVSTDMQSEDGYSLDGQIERCKAYCASQGWEVYDIYIEEGESAKDLNRPELQRLLRDAERGLFDVVLVYKLDRLTRSVRDLHKLLDTFEKYGIKFRSATEIYDTTTAMGKLFITIVAALAEWERGNLAERVRFGMETLIDEGQWPGGPVPVGYSWDKDTMQMSIIDDEARTLRELRRVYMSGEGFGSTATILNTTGFTHRGAPWSSQSVWYVLDNPFYAGKLRYGGKKKNGKYASRKKEERVSVKWANHKYPTIFTWEEYEEHNARMKRREFYGHSKKREYWFTGVIRCARCGGAMTGRPKKSGVISYICSNRQMRMGCDMPLLRQSVAESHIMKHIQNIVAHRESMEEAATAEEQIQTNNAEELDNLRKELKTIADRRKKWQYAFVEELISEQDFRQRKREEDEKETILLDRIEHLKSEQIGINAGFAQMMYSLPDMWDDLEDTDRKEFMQTIFERIVFQCDVQTGKGVSGKGRSLPFRITEINYNE